MYVVGRRSHKPYGGPLRHPNPVWPWLIATGAVGIAAGSAGYLYCRPSRMRGGKVTDPLYIEIKLQLNAGNTEQFPPSLLEAIGPAEYECSLEYLGCFQGQDAYEIVVSLDGVRLESKTFASREAAVTYWEDYFGQTGGKFIDLLEAGNRPGQPLVGEYPPGVVPDPQVFDEIAANELTNLLEGESEILPGFQVQKIRTFKKFAPVCGVEGEIQLWKATFQRSFMFGSDELDQVETVTAYFAFGVTGVSYPTKDESFQYFAQPFSGAGIMAEGESEAEVIRKVEEDEELAKKWHTQEVNFLWLTWEAFKRDPENIALKEFLGILPSPKPDDDVRFANPMRAPLPVMYRPQWQYLPHQSTAPQFQPPSPPTSFDRLHNGWEWKPRKPSYTPGNSAGDEAYASLAACNWWCSEHPESKYCFGGLKGFANGACYDVINQVRSSSTPQLRAVQRAYDRVRADGRLVRAATPTPDRSMRALSRFKRTRKAKTSRTRALAKLRESGRLVR